MTFLLSMLGLFLIVVGILRTVAAIREGGILGIVLVRILFGAALTALGYWLHL